MILFLLYLSSRELEQGKISISWDGFSQNSATKNLGP